jgi:hypothetical protein
MRSLMAPSPAVILATQVRVVIPTGIRPAPAVISALRIGAGLRIDVGSGGGTIGPGDGNALTLPGARGVAVIKRRDTSPSIVATLTGGDEKPVDLTRASVVLNMIRASGRLVIARAPVTVVDAAGGVVRYDWASEDTDSRGEHRAEIEVTYSDGRVETFPAGGYLTIQIIEDLA